MWPRLMMVGLALSFTLACSAKESIRIMYLQSQDEERAAILIKRLQLSLDVYRLGIFRVGNSLYAGIRLGVQKDEGRLATKYEIAALGAAVSDRLFGEFPDLERIDFEGVSRRETKDEKPEVLFSTSVARSLWKTIPKSIDALARLERVGTSYFEVRVQEGEKPTAKDRSVRHSNATKKVTSRTRKKAR